ncbi:hypothetical protein WJX72_004852 [[Myrmecia] bisecta]|uniref:NB-ARC domain-containing protein n=1 Tax=[Myrmecia] bisecta TaxID=41462 RepID=A0AAW1R632_9CHLO
MMGRPEKVLPVFYDVGTSLSEALESLPAVEDTSQRKLGWQESEPAVQEVYNELQADFASSSCFLEVGSEASNTRLLELQRQMLKDLCGVEIGIQAAGLAELLRRCLKELSVLLVIDDIWSRVQLQALLVPVGSGSRVIITSRDLALLQRPGIGHRQSVDVLSTAAALELFSWHAFLAKEPPPEYKLLAARVVEACAGLPLTLTVIGALLCEQTDAEDWEYALHQLQHAAAISGSQLENAQLWGRLRISYDDLDSPHRCLFLDIACFMLGRDVDACLPALGKFATSTLKRLVQKALVKVDGNKLSMHDQLRDMGQAIVEAQSGSVERRNRVWGSDARAVVSQCKAAPVMEGVSFHDSSLAGSDSAKQAAAGALGDLAVIETNNQVHIAAAGAIKPLVELYQSDSPTSKQARPPGGFMGAGYSGLEPCKSGGD